MLEGGIRDIDELINFTLTYWGVYHQITKGKDENSVKYHASPTVRTISYYSKVWDVIYTEGKNKRKVNILGDLILFIRMFFKVHFDEMRMMMMSALY
jgi:hypothetical protein